MHCSTFSDLAQFENRRSAGGRKIRHFWKVSSLGFQAFQNQSHRRYEIALNLVLGNIRSKESELAGRLLIPTLSKRYLELN